MRCFNYTRFVSATLWSHLGACVALTFVLQSCGRVMVDGSSLLGTPSQDEELGRMRWHFTIAAPIQSLNTVFPGKTWHCVQRSAIARSMHTSYFDRTFAYSSNGASLNGLAHFQSMPPADSRGVFSLHGGTLFANQDTETDRYQIAYGGQVQVFVRMLPGYKLVEEWAVSPDASVVGRNFAIVPELISTSGRLMENAFSNRSLLAFMYASCDLGDVNNVPR